MHIAVFNQHHHNPDCPATCRHYSFLEKLAKKHDISLITSDGWRNIRISHNFNWEPTGVKLYEQHVPYNNKMGVNKRLFSYSGYAAHAFAKGITIPQPDVIWAVSTPLSTPWAAAQVAKMRRVPWVFEVQDMWPAFPIEMGAIQNKWLQNRLYSIEKKLYQRASHIITLSPDMKDQVISKGINPSKITTVLNGTDLELAKSVTAADVLSLRNKLKLGNKQLVLYAGTFGRANDIPGLMNTAALLADHSNIVFAFVGSGYYEEQLKELSRRFPNVLLLPPQPRTDIFKFFTLADLSIVSFNDLPILGSNSPSKFYDSLACSTPVIVTNPGWTKSFVEEFKCGWYTPAEQPQLLAATIKQVLSHTAELAEAGSRGKQVAKEQFDRQQLADKMEIILLNAAH
jgi:glycosyltransferase involved in cell wall biosynthesis